MTSPEISRPIGSHVPVGKGLVAGALTTARELGYETLQVFVGNREILNPPESLLLALPETRRPAAAFVCLKLAGELRGCIGTTHPAQENLALEVIHNAIAAAS